MAVRILLVDDHYLITEGLCALFHNCAEGQVLGQASEAESRSNSLENYFQMLCKIVYNHLYWISNQIKMILFSGPVPAGRFYPQ